MIIDVHTHTPFSRYSIPEEEAKYSSVTRPDRPRRAPVSWDEYMEAIAPVDKAIVFNIAPEPEGESLGLAGPGQVGRPQTGPEINDTTAEFVRTCPEKLIGFLTVHPRDPNALNEIDRCVNDYGFRGIKLGPNYQNFDPLGEDAFRIFKRAEELGLPVLLHQGASPVRFADLYYGHPRVIDRVATAFPALKVIMAHMGHPWQIDTIVVIRKHPNVYSDISGLFYRSWSWYGCMRLACEWGVMHKLLFASDFPVATPQETLDGCRRVNAILEGTNLPRVSEDDVEAMIYRDSLGLLGID